LQGDFARNVLAGHGRDAALLDTVYLLTPDGLLLSKSRAILAVSRLLGGFWRLAAAVLSLAPAALLDAAYDRVARVRYRVFGTLDACRVPRPEERARFLDAG
jgi:predicted DCC family thiol-disulfide oxidoreductase YuxK